MMKANMECSTQAGRARIHAKWSMTLVYLVALCIINFIEFDHPISRATSADQVVSKAALPMMTVDIISAGSHTKPEFQDAQQRTFGRHPSVRNFYRITEDDDADPACASELTYEQLDEVIGFCDKGVRRESAVRSDIRGKLFHPKNHTGWLCAQKRPIDGLYKVLQEYRDGLEIPDYVAIIDDDTYLNMDLLVDLLWTMYPPWIPHVRTGCVFDFLRRSKFRFPFGGFGSFVSKKSIERLLQPIDCSAPNTDAFTRMSCWRLQSNLLGELRFFRDGMSTMDLMYEFATAQPFSGVSSWTAGYCLHSDHALAYFFNYYHIAATDEKLQATLDVEPNDSLLQEFSYEATTTRKTGGRRGECLQVRDMCTVHDHVCHYMEPEQMDSLYLDGNLHQVETSTGIHQALQLLDSIYPAADMTDDSAER